MSKVKVWNDNEYPHEEEFKGEKIRIEAHQFIEMDWEEAVEFKGQYTPIKFLGDGQTHDPRGFKKIRVERPTVLPFQEKLVNHANGQVAQSPEQLAAMVAQFAHLQIKDAEADKVAAVKATEQRSEIEELKAQVARLAALVESQETKKGPGARPKKEANG